ncbi:MAG: class I SAM-dependent methyltransferase [Bacteroidales bacterium]|nr:class I SAM-dependent methyltransferase [Bacteroidales bacterium]
MNERIFNPTKRQRLNNPERLNWLPPQKLLDFIQFTNPRIVVDIGAGTGYMTMAIAKTLPAAVVLALDIEPLMIQEMQHFFSPNTNVIPKLMPHDKIPLQDNFADLIWSINVYHEFSNAQEMLREIHRVLRPKGKLLVVDWDKNPESSERGPLMDHRVSMETAVNDITSAGFINIRTTPDLSYHYAIVASKA